MFISRNLILLPCKATIVCVAICAVLILCASVWAANEIGGLHLIVKPGTVIPLAIVTALLLRR